MTSVFPTETRYSTRFTTQTDVVDGGAGAVQESTITEHIRISQVTVNQGSGRTQTVRLAPAFAPLFVQPYCARVAL